MARYAVLILDAILEHGPADGDGRRALRRMNQMHRAYDIGDDDLRYVLATRTPDSCQVQRATSGTTPGRPAGGTLAACPNRSPWRSPG